MTPFLRFDTTMMAAYNDSTPTPRPLRGIAQIV